MSDDRMLQLSKTGSHGRFAPQKWQCGWIVAEENDGQGAKTFPYLNQMLLSRPVPLLPFVGQRFWFENRKSEQSGRDTLRTVLVLSDIHYACAAERARGGAELEAAANPLQRLLVRTYRNLIWRRDPFGYNHLLDHFVSEAQGADFVIANGDYSCDSAFVGLCDDAAFRSAQECISRLRSLGSELRLVFGDHELGKISLVGGRGGLRLASLHRAREELGLQSFWTLEIGRYLLVGVTSTLLGFPVFEPEALAHEREQWYRTREEHLVQIRECFGSLSADQRIILFCHDPTALPFLWGEPTVRARLAQLEHTIIGHLHSELFLWKSRLLSGMPTISFLGHAIRRMSRALHDAKLWRPFKVKLCPALGGIDLLHDGGYYRLGLNPAATQKINFEFRRFERAQLRPRPPTAQTSSEGV